MPRPTPALIAAILTVALSANGLAQAEQPSQDPSTDPDPRVRFENIWPQNSIDTQPGNRVFVVTLAEPKHKQACRVQSIDATAITCARHAGWKPRVFRAQDVAAIIRPGDHIPILLYFVSFGTGTGAGIWGTTVLAPLCIPCAVVVGAASGLLLIMTLGSGFLIDSDYPDALTYIQLGQTLQIKLN
jgi:hypothetical protein